MAIAHFSIKARRVSEARPATDVVQYLTREGRYAPEDPDVAYLTRTAPTSENRQDLRHGPETQHLPAWAKDDAATFFSAAAQHEPIDGRYAYAIQFALPRELTHEQHVELTRDFLEATMHDKPLLWVKHEPIAQDGERQPHIHVLMSARMVDGIARGPAQTFQRWDRKTPERGGMHKDRFWNESYALQQMRFAYADMANYHLERAGVEARIDVRTLHARGIDRKPQPKYHKTPQLARDEAHEQAKAQAAWEQRKAYKQLGDVTQIPREEFVLQVRQWTRAYVRGQQGPQASLAEVQAWQERDRQRRAQEISQLVLQIKLLAIQLSKLGSQEERAGQGLRARLQRDATAEKEQGHSY